METIERAPIACELGMLRRALWAAPPIVAAALLALLLDRPLEQILPLAIAALFLSIALGWRGGNLSHAVMPGLLAGGFALLIPLLMMRFFCEPRFCLPACAAAGLASGILVGARSRRGETPLRFVFSAAAIAGLLGAMGCSVGGTFGILGMSAGLIVGGAPLLIVTRR
jgi:hypothetical protein